jgi:hypothetical protein
VGLLIGIVELVKMLNHDGAEVLVGTRELRQNMGREREQRNKDEDNPLLDDTQRPKDVGLLSTHLLNHRKVIWMKGM